MGAAMPENLLYDTATPAAAKPAVEPCFFDMCAAPSYSKHDILQFADQMLTFEFHARSNFQLQRDTRLPSVMLTTGLAARQHATGLIRRKGRVQTKEERQV